METDCGFEGAGCWVAALGCAAGCRWVALLTGLIIWILHLFYRHNLRELEPQYCTGKGASGNVDACGLRFEVLATRFHKQYFHYQ